MNTTIGWYHDESFIFGSISTTNVLPKWYKVGCIVVGQKVNHDGIFDIFEVRDEVDGLLNNEFFQEEESTELSPFQPIEEMIESSTLIWEDIEPLMILGVLAMDLNINHEALLSDDDNDGYDDRAEAESERKIFTMMEIIF